MSLYLPDKCLRGLTTCRPYCQIASDLGEEHEQSFFCGGKNDGSLGVVPEDRYTLCFKGQYRNDQSYNDRRDLVDQAFVIMGLLAHIELDDIDQNQAVVNRSKS